MSVDEGCFACGAVRLEPFGEYTIQAAHEKELGRMREALRAAEKRELEALAELDEEREELNRLRRLVPTGTYTLTLAHEQEIQRLRDQADEWRLKAADYSNRMDEWKLKEGEARDLLRAVAAACRGLGPRTDAVMSVVGNALAERDEARAEVERLRWGNDMACENTPTAGCECPGCETARDRAVRGETQP